MNITFDDNLITGNKTIDSQRSGTDRPHPAVRRSMRIR